MSPHKISLRYILWIVVFMCFQTLWRVVACQVECLLWVCPWAGTSPLTSSQTSPPWHHQLPHTQTTMVLALVECQAWPPQLSLHRDCHRCTPQGCILQLHPWAPHPCFVWAPQVPAHPQASPIPHFIQSTYVPYVVTVPQESTMVYTGKRFEDHFNTFLLS